jgi:hypothetical protein
MPDTMNIPIVISATKQTSAIAETVADIKGMGPAAAAAATQANAAAASQAAGLAKVGGAAKDADAARAAAAAAEKAQRSESLALIALKVRAVDAASASEVQALRDSIVQQRAQLEAVGATEAEYVKLDLVLQGLEKRVQSVASAQDAAAKSGAAAATKINGVSAEKLRGASMAVSQIALAAEGATVSAQGLAGALGMATQSIGLMAGGAQFALIASGLGAVVTVGAALYTVLQRVNAEAKVSQSFTDHLSHADFKTVTGRFDAAAYEKFAGEVNSRRDQLLAEATKLSHDPSVTWITGPNGVPIPMPVGQVRAQGSLAAYQEAAKEAEAVYAKGVALRHEDLATRRQIAFAQDLEAKALERTGAAAAAKTAAELHAAQATAQGVPAQTIKLAQMREEAALSIEALKREYERRDELGQVIPMTAALAAQLRERIGQQVALNAALREEAIHQMTLQNIALVRASHDDHSAGGDYAQKKAAIEAERQADLRTYESTEENRAMIAQKAELKLRQLRLDTFRQSISYAGEFTKVLEQSGSRQVRAVGHAADAIRKILIGADGAHSAVLALKEGAAALGALASGNFAGAALHTASAAQYAAAAAKAGQESLGGGGASGGGGGGGGAGTPTFEPRSNDSQGNLVVNLITRDPYGRDAIQTTLFELDRSQKLKRPIPIAPTTGLVPFAA